MEAKKRQANFQRTKYYAAIRLGSRQKSKLTYRRARGRHNKTRQKWRSRPPMVEIGYKNKCQTRGLINDKTPIMIQTLSDLNKVGKDNIAIIAKVGNKLKMQIAKEIIAKKIGVLNLNTHKFMKQMEREMKFRTKDKNKTEAKPEAKK